MTPETVPTIKVSIAKLGTSIQEVEVPVGATVMQALRKAGFNLDGVVSVKRNGSVIAMDGALGNEDVLLVSMDKIKGGLVEESPEGNLLKLSFKIVKENQADANGQLAFTDDMSTFEIVKQVMHSKGVSLNYFKEMKDNEGHLVSFEDKLEDGGDYTIVIAETVEASDSDDEDVVGANND